MLNKAMFQGLLGNDVKITKSDSGVYTARFSVAVKKSWKKKDSTDWEEKVSWVNVVSFQEGYIEKIKDKLEKGAHVIVEGELSEYDYTNDEGVRRRGLEIVMGYNGSVQFLPKWAKGDGVPTNSAPDASDAPPAESHDGEVKDADPDNGGDE